MINRTVEIAKVNKIIIPSNINPFWNRGIEMKKRWMKMMKKMIAKQKMGPIHPKIFVILPQIDLWDFSFEFCWDYMNFWELKIKDFKKKWFCFCLSFFFGLFLSLVSHPFTLFSSILFFYNYFILEKKF